MKALLRVRLGLPPERRLAATFALLAKRHSLSAATLITVLLTLPGIAKAQTGPSGVGTIDTDALATILDPSERAFYYGRVIEIPTPRWTAYDAKYFGVCLPQARPGACGHERRP